MTISLEQLHQTIHQAAEEGTELHLSAEDTSLLADLLDNLMRPIEPDFQGQGQTMGEIAEAGGFGVWAHREDIKDGISYAIELRRQAERRG
jgi:hypothetical protein